jgi:hypothetical protein
MVYKKMKIKKSQNTMTGLIITILIVMGIFMGGYLFVVENLTSDSVGLDSKYENTYGNLTESSEDLTDKTKTIKTNVQGITEAPNIYKSTWNGLLGIGNTLLLFLGFSDIALTVYESIASSLEIIPGWAMALIFTGVLTFIVILVLRAMKGDPAM